MSKPSLRKWDDISDILTEDGAAKVTTGQLLIFNYEGSRIGLKIMRKQAGKVWAKKVELYKPEDVEVIDAEQPAV